MKIVLKPMPGIPAPPEGAIVGTLDGEPLMRINRYWRTPSRSYQTEELGEDLVEAVDEAATLVLGAEWVTNLARLSQLNRRSTSKDRIARFGLPEYVLVWLGQAAASKFPRAIGHYMMIMDIVQSAPWIMTVSDKTGRPTSIDLVNRGHEVSCVADEATALFDGIQAEREAFRKVRPVMDD